MDSEIELNDAIQEMHILATQPDLYPVIVQMNFILTMVQLLSHENTGKLSVNIRKVYWLREIVSQWRVKNWNERRLSFLRIHMLDWLIDWLIDCSLDCIDWSIDWLIDFSAQQSLSKIYWTAYLSAAILFRHFRYFHRHGGSPSRTHWCGYADGIVWRCVATCWRIGKDHAVLRDFSCHWKCCWIKRNYLNFLLIFSAERANGGKSDSEHGAAGWDGEGRGRRCP